MTGGAGAVGLSAIALGKHLGANIITTVSSEVKAAAARAAGAEHIVNYREENLAEAILKIAGGQKIDRIVDVALSDHMEGASALAKCPSSSRALKPCAPIAGI